MASRKRAVLLICVSRVRASHAVQDDGLLLPSRLEEVLPGLPRSISSQGCEISAGSEVRKERLRSEVHSRQPSVPLRLAVPDCRSVTAGHGCPLSWEHVVLTFTHAYGLLASGLFVPCTLAYTYREIEIFMRMIARSLTLCRVGTPILLCARAPALKSSRLIRR